MRLFWELTKRSFQRQLTYWGALWPVYALSAGIALTVTLERIAMGVHYPFEYSIRGWAGIAKRGGAGVTILAWQAVGCI